MNCMKLLTPRYFWLLLSAMIILPKAEAATDWQIYRDDHGMPRCIGDKNSWYHGFYFHWDDSKQYQRKLYAIPLMAFRSQGYPEHCSNWAKFAGTAANSAPFFLSDENEVIDTTKLDADIPDSVKTELNQAKLGAYAPWTTATFAYYADEARRLGFTKEFNKRLTDEYGIYFSTDVFRSWLRSKEKNIKLENRILGHIQQLEKKKAKPIAQRLRGYKLIIGRGYFEGPNDSRVQLYIDEMKALGINTSAFAVDTTASVTENAQVISEQIERELEAGNKLIVSAASKGSAELYGALALLNARKPQYFVPGVTRGKIAAVLSVSGTLRGSFIVDWAMGALPYQIVRWAMYDEAKRTGINLKAVRPGLESQSTDFLSRYFGQHARSLPTTVPFFDVVGTPSPAVADQEGFVKDLRVGLLDTGMFPRHCASDGMVEYPNMVTPDEWARENYQIVVESTHPIFDGNYQGVSMGKRETRRRVLEAFFQAITDRIEGKF